MNVEKLLENYRKNGYRVSARKDPRDRYQRWRVIMCLGDYCIVTKTDRLTDTLLACSKDLLEQRGDNIPKLMGAYHA